MMLPFSLCTEVVYQSTQVLFSSLRCLDGQQAVKDDRIASAPPTSALTLVFAWLNSQNVNMEVIVSVQIGKVTNVWLIHFFLSSVFFNLY